MIGAVAVSMVLLTMVVFPFVARAFVANSIPEVDTTPTKSQQGGRSSSSEGGLGVRELPLLSASDIEVLQADQTSAILEASSAVFDDSARAYARVAESERLVMAHFEGLEQGDVDLGAALDVVDRAFAGEVPAEADVLRLVGYLLVSDANDTIDSNLPSDVAISRATMAVALVDRAAAQFDSCDSKLALAHTRSLLRVLDRAPVDALFDAAALACGPDITPTVARAYYDLAFASEGPGATCEVLADKVGPRAWDFVIRQFREVQQIAPGNPAGYVGEGDTYRIAADVLGGWGVQPFTVRAYLRSALTAYEEARGRSSAPEIAVSQAKVHLSLDQAERAVEMLKRVPSAVLDEPGGRDLEAAAFAATGRYGEAAELARAEYERVQGALSEPIAHQLVGINAAYGPTAVTGRADAAAPNIFLLSACGGGSLAHDYGFTPVKRPLERTTEIPEAQLDYAVLGRQWEERPEICEEPSSPNELPCEILLGVGDVGELSEPANDYLQNLLRGAGDLKGAASLASAWADANPDSPTAHERLGEIRFLQKDWGAAARESTTAAKAYAEGRGLDGAYEDRSGRAWAQLRAAVAEREAGRPEVAHEQLEALAGNAGSVDDGSAESDSARPALLPIYVEQELGVTQYDLGDGTDALKHLKRSIALANNVEKGANVKVNRGVQAQVASAAALKLKHFDEARSFARQAIDIDPFSPLFRETFAEAERNLDKESATAAYRAALENDPTLFSTWNNLGVLEFQAGRTEEAIASFGHALAIRPEYATAWFNLGVAEADVSGIGHFLRSQGALGKAASLDGGFKNQAPKVTFDEEIYIAGLDLSRPVPEEWQLAETSRSRPALLGIGLFLMLVLRILWALGSDWLVGRGIARAIEQEVPRWPRLRRLLVARPSAVWTTLVSLIALVVLAGASGAREIAYCVVAFGALIVAHRLAPRVVAGGASIRHASFLPASVLTAVLAVFGLGFTPPAPIANEGSDISPRVRRSGVVALGVLVVILGMVAWSSAVPLSRSAAIAGLLLVSSALVPVPPLDGARLGVKRSIDVGVALAVGAATVLFAAGVV